MLRRRALVALSLAVGLLVPVATGQGVALGQGDNRAEVGEFLAPFAEDPTFADRAPQNIEESLRTPPVVSVAMMPDGKIVYWGGLEGLEDSAAPIAFDAGRSHKLSRARALDLRSGTAQWSIPSPEVGGVSDMFCADQRLMANGKLLIAGGTVWKSDPVDLSPITGEAGPGGTAELFGSKETRLYDSETETFTGTEDGVEEMEFGRWYPGLVTLGDGRLFVAGGVGRLIYNTDGFNVEETEIFDPATNEWTTNSAEGATTLPLFPRLHLLPDGKVYYAGAGQMWGPFGQTPDEALWGLHKAYDPASDSWEITGLGATGVARSGVASVLLPFSLDADGNPTGPARILQAGGTLGSSPGSYIANNLTEIITVDEGGTSSERVADLNNPRWYSSGVLLPDGNVFVVNGGDKDEVVWPGAEAPVRQAEIYDVASDTWTPVESTSRDRVYHNTAILLPDGSVLVSGHSPINAGYGDKGNGTGDTTIYGNETTEGYLANNLKDPSLEIYKPPYMFRGDRPEITSAQKEIAWQESNPAAFPVNTDDNDAVDKVVLVRLPSTTHVTDADMRMLELEFTNDTGRGELMVERPANGNIAPAGYYYLFVVKNTEDGPVPSTARIVKVSGTPDVGEQAIAPMGS